MIKILAGFHEPDEGRAEINGEPVALPIRPGEFRKLGLAFVHQDLGLIPTLTVVENLRVRLLAPGGPRAILWRRQARIARGMFEKFGLDIDPWALVGELPAASRAMLAIVRALDDIQTFGRPDRRGLLILDETTVFLPHNGREQLLDLLRRISRTSASILFVSHDLAEVQAVTDRITVLRDGSVAGVEISAETTEQRLIGLIVGKNLEASGRKPPRQRPESGAAAITVEGLRYSDIGRDQGLDFEIRRGEILGLTGLIGSGFERVPYLLFGGLPAEAGRMKVGAKPVDLARTTPWKSIEMGFALVPANRLSEGAVGNVSVSENISLQVLSRFRPWALRLARIRDQAAELLKRFDVRPDDPTAVYATLSGGNQQKVLLAKWLRTEPKIILLHEPTQGVDVGARAQIFSIIRDAVAGGSSVVVASNDLEQIAAVCDRALLFAQGRIAGELAGDALTKARLAEECFGSAADLPVAPGPVPDSLTHGVVP
jgi:ribose transport system ATP-binding protein